MFGLDDLLASSSDGAAVWLVCSSPCCSGSVTRRIPTTSRP